jgi:NADH dehydrogenase
MDKRKIPAKRPAAPKRRAATERPRIAIVGGNFAGLTAAQGLGREYDVTVIDRSPHFEWLPNIHELLSGEKRTADLRLSRARVVKRAGHRFLRAEVETIDAAAGTLVTSTGREVRFDACIVAVGGVGETYGVRGVERNAMTFKSVDDCARIGRRLESIARQRGKRSVVIVGGGFEGIEALGEILRKHRGLPGLSITIVEAGPRLLPGMPAGMAKAVLAHCVAQEVRVCTGSPVNAVLPTRVRLESGESLPSSLTIWTGGITAPAILFKSRLAPKPRKWAPVQPTLQSRRFKNVFVVGDAAALPRPLAKQAYFAMQMGECAAANVKRWFAGRRLRAFDPSPKPKLVAFGDLDTYFVAGGTMIASPRLAALKEAVYQATMAQIDPPVSPAALRNLASRLSGGLRGIALPGVSLHRSLLFGR